MVTRRAPRALATAVRRRMSSSASGQSRPIPRCAVSIASATPKPSDQVVGAGAAKEERAACVGGGGAAADELECKRPVEAHSALRGVHRLGDAKAERPEILAVGESSVPDENRVGQRRCGAQRIDDYVSGGEGDAGCERAARCGEMGRAWGR